MQQWFPHHYVDMGSDPELDLELCVAVFPNLSVSCPYSMQCWDLVISGDCRWPWCWPNSPYLNGILDHIVSMGASFLGEDKCHGMDGSRVDPQQSKKVNASLHPCHIPDPDCLSWLIFNKHKNHARIKVTFAHWSGSQEPWVGGKEHCSANPCTRLAIEVCATLQ